MQQQMVLYNQADAQLEVQHQQQQQHLAIEPPPPPPHPSIVHHQQQVQQPLAIEKPCTSCCYRPCPHPSCCSIDCRSSATAATLGLRFTNSCSLCCPFSSCCSPSTTATAASATKSGFSSKTRATDHRTTTAK